MKVGVNEATELKSISEKRGIQFADLLFGYAIEDLIRRIYGSSFSENMILLNGENIIDDKGFISTESKLSFYYKSSDKKKTTDRLKAGEAMSIQLMDKFAEEAFFPDNKYEVTWMYRIDEDENGIRLTLSGEYREMIVPVNVSIIEIESEELRYVKKEFATILDPQKRLSYYSYSPENILAENVFEIMKKLELIGDMKSYYTVNEILKNHSISGRHIIEELEKYAEKEPKVLKMKRIEQISGYREYSYMKKRWVQYCKNHKHIVEDWQEILDRVVGFIKPLWISLCNNEVFLDDWMPELGRFLS